MRLSRQLQRDLRIARRGPMAREIAACAAQAIAAEFPGCAIKPGSNPGTALVLTYVCLGGHAYEVSVEPISDEHAGRVFGPGPATGSTGEQGEAGPGPK